MKNRISIILFLISFITIFLNLNDVNTFAEQANLPAKGYVDGPAHGSTVKGYMNVTGWFLDGSGVSKVEIMIDGKSIGDAKYGISRPDVKNAFPAYQNLNSGFQYTLDTTKFTNGKHTLTIRETSANGNISLLNSIEVNIENLPTKGYIDTPGDNSIVEGIIPVRGWFLDVIGVSKIEVLIDGNLAGTAQYGNIRTDVNKVFPQYQNLASGYHYLLDTRNLTNGLHSLTIRETAQNGTTTTLSSKILTIQNLPARGYVDEPASGVTIKGKSNVRGWFLDGSGVSKIEILLDGKSVGQAEYGKNRNDVQKVFPNYQNANSGFLYTLDTAQITNGAHTLTVRETGNNGIESKINQIINIENLKTLGNVDNPVNNAVVNGTIEVRGWALDDYGLSKVEILVDGKVSGIAKYGSNRPDVARVFPKYNNSNSGFLYSLDTTKLTNGQHSIMVRETGINGESTIIGTQTVNVKNLQSRGSIDAPTNGATIQGDTIIKGWSLDGNGVKKIEVLVDGITVGAAQYGLARPDVKSVFPEYQNANAGYQYTLNAKNLKNGSHTITVKEIGNDGTTSVIGNQIINVQNLPAKGDIDNPKANSTIKGTIDVKGWFLDGSDVSKVEIFVDGAYMGAAQYGSFRPDVANVYPAYNNKNSGFQYSIDTLRLSEGKHTLTVKETGTSGSTYELSNVIFVYNENPYTEIDLRKPANITANDIINFFNQKRPDSPLKNYAQNFIDAQNKYGVNAQYLVAHAIWETGWGGSNLRTYKHNLFGYGAYDVAPFTAGYYFPTGADSINFEAYIVRKDYLNADGSYYNGPNLTGMNVKYATDKNWANGIANLMQSMKPFDPVAYSQAGILPGSSVAPSTFGRDIPAGQPYPTDIVINYTNDTNATVMTSGLTLRTLPYISTSTVIRYLPLGTAVKVLGYNTDVKYNPDDQEPYDKRWYRVLVNGQAGWLYGGGIAFNP
ncbi:Ig-like domain-containing protein [Bacillota bacterium Lsc_1132]